MIVTDRVYGKIVIKEKVIKELVASMPMQRLAKISQDGAAHFIQPVRNVNRLEHSIGVWYLSYLYRRPIEEQVASLLHDVPHTAFSHVIDFVVRDEKHEFHERFTEKIIRESEIPDILNRHKISLDKVLHKEGFDLLDNDLPDISFDRWDYFMRDGVTVGFMPEVLIKEYLAHIKVYKNTFYFTDIRLASCFAILFVNFSRLIWLDPTSHGAFFLVAESLKRGLEKGIITQEDFFSYDAAVMAKLKKSKDKKIKEILKHLKPGLEFVYADEKSADFYGPNKPRFVNPWVMQKGELHRLDTLVPSLSYYFEEFASKYKNIGVIQD